MTHPAPRPAADPIRLVLDGRGRPRRWDPALGVLLGREAAAGAAPTLAALLPLAGGGALDLSRLRALCDAPAVLVLAGRDGPVAVAAAARRGRWRPGRGRDVILTLAPTAAGADVPRADGPSDASAAEAARWGAVTASIAPDGTIRAVNDRFLAAFGYRREEVVGEGVGLLHSAEEAHSAEHRAFWRALRAGEPWTGKRRHRDRAGAPVWLLCDYVPLRGPDGAVREVVLQGGVVTALHEAARSAHAKVAALDASQGVIEFAPDGEVLAANAVFLRVMGYEAAEVVGWHHRMFVDPSETSEAEHARFWERLRAGAPEAGQVSWLGRDGRRVWLQATYAPVRDDEGRVERVVTFAQDVTARVERDALARGRLDALHRANAVIEFAPDGTILAANENFLLMTGYERADALVGRDHAMLVDEATAAAPDYAAFWQALREGRPQAGEFRRRRADGGAIWVRLSCSPVLDAAGAVTRILQSCTDVTATHERAARDGAKAEAIERSHATVAFDLQGNVVEANDAFLATMGYARDEVLGRNHSIFCDRGSVGSAEYRQFWDDLRAGRFRSGEFRRRAKNGDAVWIRGVYNPIRNAAGEVVGVSKFAADITEEVARRERVELLSLVTDRTVNSVVIADARGRIEYVNRGFVELTGYELRDVQGKKPGDVLQGPKTCPATVARVREKLARREPFYEEILNYDRSGRPYWISLAVNPVLAVDGTVERFVSIQSDIDATKRASLTFTRQLEAISSASAIAEWSADGAPLGVNRYLGDRGAVARTLDGVLPPGERACIKSGETIRRMVEWPRADGDRLTLDAVFNAVEDGNGELSKVMMFGIDTTERDALVNGAMAAMRSSTDRIEGIVASIGEIGNQTRTLSLNASVEASRAGDAGRGFAVVAGEVRVLADKATAAAQRIGALLRENRARAEALDAAAHERASWAAAEADGDAPRPREAEAGEGTRAAS